MCKHGTTIDVWVTIPTYQGTDLRIEAHKKLCPIDSCIATIVAALENGGVMMGGSCCGHGKGDGEILLEDGRRLIIKVNKNDK